MTNKEEVKSPKGVWRGVKGSDHPRYLHLSKIEEGQIRQFSDWKDKNPQTISNRLKDMGIVIGVTRVKRLQEQEVECTIEEG